MDNPSDTTTWEREIKACKTAARKAFFATFVSSLIAVVMLGLYCVNAMHMNELKEDVKRLQMEIQLHKMKESMNIYNND